MYKKILVPLDGSTESEAVLPHVLELAKCAGAQIVLLRVVTDPVLEMMFAGEMPALTIQDERVLAHTQAEGYLQRVASDEFPATLNVKYEVSGGPIAETILDYAAGIEADLIAMSTHGRGGFARLVLGSITDEIVRRSHLPVLLIRPQNN